MMGDQRGRGKAYMEEADKALKRFALFNANQKFEDASEAYTKAGNCFKVAKAWAEGGEAFTRASELHVKLGSTYDAANAAQEAANCYKNINPEDAIGSFRQAATLLMELGKFKQIGKIHKDIAEIYEKEGSYDEAVENYMQAAEYFNSENNKSSANDAMQKTAFLLTTTRGAADPSLDNYARAANIFEEMGVAALDNRLLQYNAKSHFMNALLCYMAMGDEVAVKQKLEHYKASDYTFADARECKFIEKLVQAWEESSADDYTDHCAEYNAISALDPWKTSLLVKTKRMIAAVEHGEEDVDLT
ncbi:soluble nsf attachment protein alpha isoform [Nannochloropsis oceanica]